MKQNSMLAMILAGGRGSRLHDLTNKVAKPAVSYGGKYKIIDFPLSNCANSGIDVVGVLTQYESVLLNSYVAAGIDGTGRKVVPVTAESSSFRPVRKQMRTWMYTGARQMRSPRILILWTTMIRSIC